ncbi:MAG: efflux RND transporter periplasmic adaptor subunit [Deltaproteobacteria bacterium]|nr:efflux RND transporter periplasmic adaptor subunit [Deltaproteobacteria bacterium]
MTARLSKLAGELRRRPRAFWLFVGAAALLVAATLLLFAAAPEPRRVAAAGEQATAAPVRALALRPRPMQRETRSSGVVEPRRRVSLLSETRGRVLRVGAAELDSVAEGQLLLQVDPLLAEVAVERGRAAVARAESQLALARDARTRFQRLAERDVASAARLDQAVNDARVAEANLREARANLSEARSQLRKKKLRAPFAGVLQRFPVEAGEFLREGDLAAELLDLETVRIELGVSDREVVALKVGQPVRAELDAYPGEIFEAEVLRVGAAADPASRRFPVEIEFDNPGRRLLPGMVARVTLQLGAPEPMRAIPRDAAIDEFGVRFVYLLRREGGRDIVRRQPVEVRDIPFRPGQVEVVSGLRDGERIAVGGIRALRDGAAVRIEAEAELEAMVETEAARAALGAPEPPRATPAAAGSGGS